MPIATLALRASGDVAEDAAAPPAPADACAALRLSREGDQVAAGGLTGPLGVGVGVVVDVGCEWQVEKSERWLTITSGGFGKGSGVISYLVAPHSNVNTRNGKLVVTAKGVSRTFTVNQVGVPAESAGGASGGKAGRQGMERNRRDTGAGAMAEVEEEED